MMPDKLHIYAKCSSLVFVTTCFYSTALTYYACLQMPTQQSPSQPAASTAVSGPKHGATTITDPVQMMWQQQQIKSPSPQNLHKAVPQLWPPPEQVAPSQKAVASPGQRRQQQHSQPHGKYQQQHSQQLSQQHNHHLTTQSQAGFQPFQHSLLPQLRTSAALPSSPASSSSTSLPMACQTAAHIPHCGGIQFPPGVPASLGFNSGSHQSDGMPASSPSLQQRTAAVSLVPHFSAPFSLGPSPQSPSSSAWGSARGSFDGYSQPAEEPGSEALSTFHLPEGLAEQLSTSHSHPLPSSHKPQPHHLPPSPASDAQLQQQRQQQQAQVQAQAFTPQPDAKQTKSKLTSPPGFATRLDGAAKPFVPGRPVSAGSESSQQHVQGLAASTPWTPTARGHLRPPPGMGVSAGGSGSGRSSSYSHVPSSPGYLAGQQLSTGIVKLPQPANLASGHWALANNTDGVGPVLGTPFSQSLSSGDRPFGPETHSSISSSSRWQVPNMQLAQPGHQYDTHAAACVLDTDQHETSGLAPNDVLDFLGIGSDEQHKSDAPQVERHRSQGPSSNGDSLHSPWLNN